jgi:hypothetical protein
VSSRTIALTSGAVSISAISSSSPMRQICVTAGTMASGSRPARSAERWMTASLAA